MRLPIGSILLASAIGLGSCFTGAGRLHCEGAHVYYAARTLQELGRMVAWLARPRAIGRIATYL